MTPSDAIRALEALQNEIQIESIASPLPYERYLRLVGEHQGLSRGIEAIRKISVRENEQDE